MFIIIFCSINVRTNVLIYSGVVFPSAATIFCKVVFEALVEPANHFYVCTTTKCTRKM